ncbi:MAG: hypothetical protein FD123_3917 [Bacteroidetes bacterium]|nr:MAG: hypothetical protein FD123_3917 [Bacteroidota bacterium]
MATVDKIIVTNKSALRKKYGVNFSLVENSLANFIAADAARGMTTKLVYLDDATVKKYGAVPVRSASNGHQNKDTVDKIFRYFKPDYLLLLGARDVVPHIKLTNLTNDEDGTIIDSDLPYASDYGYSRDGRNFLAPTRVIGRVPDITGGRDHTYLTRLIDNIAGTQKLKRKDYADWLAVTAKEWIASSSVSVANIFSSTSGLLISPPAKGQLNQTRVHFFNCHGGLRDSRFYGQDGDDYPVAFSSAFLDKKLKPGTFVAAECCYGAELFDQAQGQDMSISNKYLLQNAVAYVGSTTVAYGPTEGQGGADLITQYFVINVLKGYSTGRAFLEARQKFINVSGPRIDAVELKTIMQFLLLGDPSLHLVDHERTTTVFAKGKLRYVSESEINAYRKARRKQLYENGNRVGDSTELPKRKTVKISAGRHKLFSPLVRQLGFRDFSSVAFSFGNKKTGNEKHYFYLEKKHAGRKKHHPRILVFKETGDDIIVRLYERK